MEPVDEDDVILQTDISSRLLFNTDKNGPEVRGGQPDALVVLATKATKGKNLKIELNNATVPVNLVHKLLWVVGKYGFGVDGFN